VKKVLPSNDEKSPNFYDFYKRRTKPEGLRRSKTQEEQSMVRPYRRHAKGRFKVRHPKGVCEGKRRKKGRSQQIDKKRGRAGRSIKWSPILRTKKLKGGKESKWD